MASASPPAISETLTLTPSGDPRRRLRRLAARGLRRGSGAATPLRVWGLDGSDRSAEGGGGGDAASARRLAAALWRTRPPRVGGGGEERRAGLGFEVNSRHLRSPCPCCRSAIILHNKPRNRLAIAISPHFSNNGGLEKVETRVAYNASERTTKFTSVVFVSCLREELEFAHRRINKLEFERRSVNEKVDHMLQKFEEEKASWRRREHEKIQNVIASIKNDLSGERKNRRRMEIANAKLAAELNEANLQAKRNLRDYEREKGARELAEDACDELVKEIGEDKSEIEALKRELVRIREEVEEETRMLQMAEVWREERVKMKLVDANLTLHNKYSELNELKADLQAFLKAQAGNDADMESVRKAHMLKDAVESTNVCDTREFSYQPPNSKDIFSIFQELIEETSEEEISQVYECSPTSHDSKIHPVSPETEMLEEPISGCTIEGADTIGDTEDDDGWVSLSKVEEQGLSNSLEGSELSANGLHEYSNAPVSGIDWDDDKENDNIFCSNTDNRQSNKKGSSSVDGENRKNRSLPNDEVNYDTPVSSPSNLGQLSSLESLNPHVTRGMKGFVEWTRGMQRLGLRSKPIEASINRQKIQLPHTTKQKT